MKYFEPVPFDLQPLVEQEKTGFVGESRPAAVSKKSVTQYSAKSHSRKMENCSSAPRGVSHSACLARNEGAIVLGAVVLGAVVLGAADDVNPRRRDLLADVDAPGDPTVLASRPVGDRQGIVSVGVIDARQSEGRAADFDDPRRFQGRLP